MTDSLGEFRRQFVLTHLYCGRCMRWYHLESVKWNIRRQPLCPTCHSILRVKSRHNKHRSQKLMQQKVRLIDQMRSLKT
jgi:uncharacterized protein YbaR (Trm112 family)